MSEQGNTRFGIEIETIITGAGKAESDWETSAGGFPGAWTASSGHLGKALAQAGIANHLRIDDDEKEEYQEWSVTTDLTIRDDRPKNRWGIELVSPVLEHKERNRWTGELATIFEVLEKNEFGALGNESCATHVHVSMKEGWTVEHVRKVAKAIIYHNEGLQKLVHKTSAKDLRVWAFSNRLNALLADKNLVEILAALDALGTIKDIVLAMCPLGNDGKNDKYIPGGYSWNFYHLLGVTGSMRTMDYDRDWNDYKPEPMRYAKNDTVEFRLAPASQNAREARQWVDFANLFVIAATRRNEP